jgi:hypothetical protein
LEVRINAAKGEGLSTRSDGSPELVVGEYPIFGVVVFDGDAMTACPRLELFLRLDGFFCSR